MDKVSTTYFVYNESFFYKILLYFEASISTLLDQLYEIILRDLNNLTAKIYNTHEAAHLLISLFNTREHTHTEHPVLCTR